MMSPLQHDISRAKYSPGNDSGSSLPVSKKSHTSDWITKPNSFLLVIFGLFVLIFGIAISLGYRQLETTIHHSLVADKTTANLLATFIRGHNQAVTGILQSYAFRPLFVEAVKHRDIHKVHYHLSELKKHHEIDLTFVTDTKGVLWANYPVFPESIGKNLSYRDWYQGIRSNWTPYVSTVFKLIVGNKPLAAALCVPVFNEKGTPIGILATSQRLDFLNDTIQRVPYSPHTTVTVIDRTGKILYSNKLSYRDQITDYPSYSMIDHALKIEKRQIEGVDQKNDQGKTYFTIAPLTNMGWVVVVERTLKDIVHSEYKNFIAIGVIALLLFILIASSVVYIVRISLLKKTEALLKTEEEYRRIFESSREGIFRSSLEGRFITANRAMAKTLGYSSPEELIDAITDISAQLYVNREVRNKIIAIAREKGFVHQYELQVYRKDKSKIWVEASFNLVADTNGIPQYMEGFLTDISERKHAEEQILRQSKLLEAINHVFYETLTAFSLEEIAQTCLKVAQELTGSKFGFIGEITQAGLFSMTALSDPGWDACRIPETQAILMINDMPIRGIWGQVLLKEQSVIVNDFVAHAEHIESLPEGHPPITSFLGVPLREQSKVIGMIALANSESGYTENHQRDLETLSISFVEAIHRKKAEQEILKLNEDLEKRVSERTALLETANKELEAFSYSVSHDLRAPLRGIDGFSQVLLEECGNKLNDTELGYLERVRKATRHMGGLIDDILKLAHVSRLELHREAVDLSKMIKTIVMDLQKTTADRTVDVMIQEGIVVQGDPYLMHICLLNLLDNAWKFTGQKEHPGIEFGMTIKDEKPIYFIEDNGVGFDMTYRDKLFVAFQRLHTSHEFPGTGIGLTTVKRIIDRHGGRIWAEAEIGKGATFYFTLPS